MNTRRYLESLTDVFTFHLHALSHQLQAALIVVHLEDDYFNDVVSNSYT